MSAPAEPSAAPIRVLLVSHTCQSRSEGQPKAVELARHGDLDLRVLIPRRWKHYGRWRDADRPEASAFRAEIRRAAWAWAGPAQFYLHWYPSLGRLLREFRPEVIDLWEEPWGLVSAQAAWLRRRCLPSARLLCETEQNLNKTLPPPFEAIRRRVLREADFVIGRNRESIDVVRGKGYAGEAEVVPNAVDEALFRPLDRDACRAALGARGCVAGYVGRLVEEKGLADLVDAAARCPADVSVLLVGAGAFEADLRRRIEQRGLGARVRILPARPLEQLPALMNALDVLVLPSRTTPRWKEQFGRVIIEAHACGTPVIGSSSGAIPEVVGAGGLVVPEGDVAALAEAMRRVRDDPAGTREMGRRGREAALARYTWKRVAARYAEIYRRLVGRAPLIRSEPPSA